MATRRLIDKLGKRFFWDMDMTKMDDDVHKQIIIERVLTIGDMEEMEIFFKLMVSKQFCTKQGLPDTSIKRR